MTKEVRVRFAPSPTGFLHIGGVRTAIFNWIYAKSMGGKFLLRIEDTDKERSTEEYHQSILSSMKWLGLDWDEDQIIQSENLESHIEMANSLLESGNAYKCYCTPEELDAKRKQVAKNRVAFKYDRSCANLIESDIRDNEDTPCVIRFRVPEGETVYTDLIHGEMKIRNSEIDDFIIMRSNGIPTYQLAVTADDHAMGVTTVIRGNDHLSNTSKQILIFKAMGWEVPEYAHMPMILGSDKAKLSKRHGAVSADSFKELGYLPEALINYLVLLGWSPGEGIDKITLDEVIAKFKIEDSLKKPAVFDTTKLSWLNGQYITDMRERDFAKILKEYLKMDEHLKNLVEEKGDDYLFEVLLLQQKQFKLVTDFISFAGYFYRDPVGFDPKAAKKHWLKDQDATVERISRCRLALRDLEEWTLESIEKAVRELADEMDVSAAKIIHPVRLALTGYGISPGLFEVIHLLGKDTCTRRFETAVKHAQTL